MRTTEAAGALMTTRPPGEVPPGPETARAVAAANTEPASQDSTNAPVATAPLTRVPRLTPAERSAEMEVARRPHLSRERRDKKFRDIPSSLRDRAQAHVRKMEDARVPISLARRPASGLVP